MKISIIIPAKDEQERLPRFLRTVIGYCCQSSHIYEIIVVDDGSKDQTAQAALVFQKEFPGLKVISLERNHGKGYAVKEGFFAAQGEIVLFLDADGSTGPEEIERHLIWFSSGYDIVIGSRVLSDGKSHVKALVYRKWMGAIFNFLVSHMLIKGIKDTQCGFKMFRAGVIAELFGSLHLEGYGFDLEVLYLAKKMNLRIKEVAVNWTHVDGSKVDIWKDSLRMFYNIIQIRYLFKYNLSAEQSERPLISVSKMSLGQKALIVAFSFDAGHGERIQEIGLYPGEILEIVGLPSQGEAIEIKIRGYFLSLPKSEADHIMVRLKL